MTLAHPEGARVLVVDDDPLLVRLVRTHLEKAGYRVIEARDGEQALDLAAAKLPDLVVLDLMLPKLDGFEVCRRIREFSLVQTDGDRPASSAPTTGIRRETAIGGGLGVVDASGAFTPLT
jgi:CheY-like chemotaxis protein